jgi:exopolysaccharide biosynthesis polyprenyl glycosylphosphotransferase
MLRRERQIRTQILQLMDGCLFALGFYCAYFLRSSQTVEHLMQALGWIQVQPVSRDAATAYIWVYPLLIFSAPLVLETQGFYNRSFLTPWRKMIWPLVRGSLFTMVGLIMALFFTRHELARWVAVWAGGISVVLVLLADAAVRRVMRSRFARSQMRRRFVLVGSKEETSQMRAELLAGADDDVMVYAEIDINERKIEDLVELLHEHSINGVILSARRAYFDKVESALRVCELEGVEAWLVADFFGTQISRTTFDDFHGRPVLVFRTAPEASWQGLLKVALDYLAAAFLLILLSPLFMTVGLVIKLTSPGPVLFRQRRCGLNGHPFTIYKFRTMVLNAEARKEELTALNEMSGPVFKISNDPRITRVGRWLRKCSLDEFPQLINVLRGEMSLVGPRPLPVDEVKRFNDMAHRRRLSVKPGMTCIWQISGRNNVSDFDDWVRLDLEYIDNWSLWLDLKILWRTIPIVLVGTGAK